MTSRHYDVTVKLAKAVKGASGYEVKYGAQTYTGKLGKDGRTIKFRGAGGSADVKVRLMANLGYLNELAGYTGWSNVKRVYVP